MRPQDGLLNRVKPPLLRQPLDGNQVLSLQLGGRKQTGRGGPVMHPPLPHLAQHHGAGAAVALAAALLDPHQLQRASQQLQHRGFRLHADLRELSV
ncbi:hypothetical protein SDC9_136137 [bioreactor metagenome]|uniref:Uncharacterized protein n=1 Tax=bioreactor metagenome TaxID=1076179 RepID=A0A645DIA5_9ZZZZ